MKHKRNIVPSDLAQPKPNMANIPLSYSHELQLNVILSRDDGLITMYTATANRTQTFGAGGRPTDRDSDRD